MIVILCPGQALARVCLANEQPHVRHGARHVSRAHEARDRRQKAVLHARKEGRKVRSDDGGLVPFLVAGVRKPAAVDVVLSDHKDQGD